MRVLFVGINPGVRSALTGHHFAGFSNRFWKLLYDSRLVPRWLPVLGFVGAALLVATWFAVLAGFVEAISPAAAVAALPIAVWEFSLGVYLTFWGFRASPITAGP